MCALRALDRTRREIAEDRVVRYFAVAVAEAAKNDRGHDCSWYHTLRRVRRKHAA